MLRTSRYFQPFLYVSISNYSFLTEKMRIDRLIITVNRWFLKKSLPVFYYSVILKYPGLVFFWPEFHLFHINSGRKSYILLLIALKRSLQIFDFLVCLALVEVTLHKMDVISSDVIATKADISMIFLFL